MKLYILTFYFFFTKIIFSNPAVEACKNGKSKKDRALCFCNQHRLQEPLELYRFASAEYELQDAHLGHYRPEQVKFFMQPEQKRGEKLAGPGLYATDKKGMSYANTCSSFSTNPKAQILLKITLSEGIPFVDFTSQEDLQEVAELRLKYEDFTSLNEGCSFRFSDDGFVVIKDPESVSISPANADCLSRLGPIAKAAPILNSLLNNGDYFCDLEDTSTGDFDEPISDNDVFFGLKKATVMRFKKKSGEEEDFKGKINQSSWQLHNGVCFNYKKHRMLKTDLSNCLNSMSPQCFLEGKNSTKETYRSYDSKVFIPNIDPPKFSNYSSCRKYIQSLHQNRLGPLFCKEERSWVKKKARLYTLPTQDSTPIQFKNLEECNESLNKFELSPDSSWGCLEHRGTLVITYFYSGTSYTVNKKKFGLKCSELLNSAKGNMACLPNPKKGNFQLIAIQENEKPISDTVGYSSLDTCLKTLTHLSSNFEARLFRKPPKRSFINRVQRFFSKWPIIGGFFSHHLRKIRPQESRLFNQARSYESSSLNDYKNKKTEEIVSQLKGKKNSWLLARVIEKNVLKNSSCNKKPCLEALVESDILQARLKKLTEENASYMILEGFLVEDYLALSKNARIIGMKTLDYYLLLKKSINIKENKVQKYYFNELQNFIKKNS